MVVDSGSSPSSAVVDVGLGLALRLVLSSSSPSSSPDPRVAVARLEVRPVLLDLAVVDEDDEVSSGFSTSCLAASKGLPSM